MQGATPQAGLYSYTQQSALSVAHKDKRQGVLCGEASKAQTGLDSVSCMMAPLDWFSRCNAACDKNYSPCTKRRVQQHPHTTRTRVKRDKAHTNTYSE